MMAEGAFSLILAFCKAKPINNQADCVNVLTNCSWEESGGLSENKAKECIKNYDKYHKFYLDKWSGGDFQQ
jgi:hypothetical protein